MKILKKIISGGQTGADQAGILAGHKAGLETGGMMPKGFRTLDGPNPEFARLYGLIGSISSDYPSRTIYNVVNSDATIRFAKNFSSRGEICTLKAIEKYNKIWIDVEIANPPLFRSKAVAEWIVSLKIKVLNVAGNSEKTAPGICQWVQEYLAEVFGCLV